MRLKRADSANQRLSTEESSGSRSNAEMRLAAMGFRVGLESGMGGELDGNDTDLAAALGLDALLSLQVWTSTL